MRTFGSPFGPTNPRRLLRVMMPHMPLYRLEQSEADTVLIWGAARGLMVQPSPAKPRRPGPAAAEAQAEMPQQPEPMAEPEPAAAEVAPAASAPRSKPQPRRPRVNVEALVAGADPQALANKLQQAAESGDALVPLSQQADA